MPAPKKPGDRRQRGRSRSDMRAEVVPHPSATPAIKPAAVATWREEVRTEWSELWGSPLAAHFNATDLAALRRLFLYRSRLADAVERAEAEPEVEGSMGQPVVSPWVTEVHRLEGSIARLEDRFGLTPMARLRLGITLEEGISLASRNAELLRSFHDAS